MSFKNDTSILKEVTGDMRYYIQELSFNIASELARDMPVDSGRARSNVKINTQPNLESNEPFFDYGKDSGKDKTETANLNTVISELKIEASLIKPFQKVFIMNNANDGDGFYADYLDKGSSKQTRAGMTQRAIFFGFNQTELKMKFEKVFK